MAETTLHFKWIVKIKLNIDKLTEGKDIFVAGDLLWYPVKGQVRICKAPDVMVAIGRPKGDRLSYLQWHEEGVAPQVVFEVLSKSNRRRRNKENLLDFYFKYGVEEFYSYDPIRNIFVVYTRQDDKFAQFEGLRNWKSRLLGIRFEWTEETLEIYHPDGERFKSFEELDREKRHLIIEHEALKEKSLEEHFKMVQAERIADLAKERAESEKKKAELAQQKVETERQKAEAAQQKAEAERQKAEAARQKAEAERQKAEAAQQKAEAERQKAEAARQKAEAERQKAEAARQKAEAERQKAEAADRLNQLLLKKLKDLGIDPDAV